MDAVTAAESREERLERLVRMHQGMLLRLCYVCLQDMELARDATQETFLKAYRKLDGFRGSSSEKTWLCRIAINTCRSLQRTAWHRHVDRSVTPEELPLAGDEFCTAEDMDVMRAIMMLPEKLREVILLHYWQEMTVGEISEALGLAHASVSGRIKRAREKLRSILDGREDDE